MLQLDAKIDYLYGWTVKGLNPARGKRFLCSTKFQTGFEVHTASYAMGTGIVAEDMKLTTQTHLVPRLRKE